MISASGSLEDDEELLDQTPLTGCRKGPGEVIESNQSDPNQAEREARDEKLIRRIAAGDSSDHKNNH